MTIEGHIGFTGSSWRLTEDQRVVLPDLLDRLGSTYGLITDAHHGDCIIADEFFHDLARYRGWRTHGHIPDNDSKRAFCNFDVIYDPQPYLVRNHDIVDSSFLLVACPDGPEVRRSGTWATIRYARKLVAPIYKVMPDGSIDPEN